MALERITVQLNGGKLSILTAGDPTGKPIVLLHGMPANATLFREVLPILAKAGYRAYAPDMLGYGETRFPDEADYSLSAVADLYAQWLETIAPVWLVGHDLGGAVSQMIAVRYPHLLTHYAVGNAPIGDSFPVFAVNLAVLAAKLGLFKTLAAIGLIPNPYMNWELRRGFGNAENLTDSILSDIFWDSKAKTAEGRHEFAKHLKALRNTESLAIVPQLMNIPVPTLVLWSELDRHQPPDKIGKHLWVALPKDTHYEVVPGAGHFMPIEAPKEYAQKLLEWRESLDK